MILKCAFLSWPVGKLTHPLHMQPASFITVGRCTSSHPLRPSTFSVKMCPSLNGSVNVSVGFFVFRKMERVPGFVLSGNNPLRSLFDPFVWTFELSDAPLCGSLALRSILEEMVGSLSLYWSSATFASCGFKQEVLRNQYSEMLLHV